MNCEIAISVFRCVCEHIMSLWAICDREYRRIHKALRSLLVAVQFCGTFDPHDITETCGPLVLWPVGLVGKVESRVSGSGNDSSTYGSWSEGGRATKGEPQPFIIPIIPPPTSPVLTSPGTLAWPTPSTNHFFLVSRIISFRFRPFSSTTDRLSVRLLSSLYRRTWELSIYLSLSLSSSLLNGI